MAPPVETYEVCDSYYYAEYPNLLTPAEASDFAARFGERRGYLYFVAFGGQLLSRGLIQA